MKSGAALEIKSRLPILEFIEQYIPVERAGKNYRARCPFHKEKTASFYISTDRNTYYCFGCGKKGDIFSFMEEYEGLDFKHALVALAEKAHVNLKDYDMGGGAVEGKKDLYAVLEQASLFFHEALSKNKTASEYLTTRGLTQKTINTFRIGFAPADWKSLYTHLTSKGFPETLIEEAGLIKKGDYGFYDRFRNRIMFPFMDTNGRVIGFSGRIIDPESKEAKYINSPESPLFNKSEIFYGLYQAKDAIRASKKAIVVEGQMDVVMTHQSGIHFVVASSGTAFSGADTAKVGGSSHLGIIKRMTDSISLAFDNDGAGLKAMYRATGAALSLGFFVYCISIVGQKDFADIARTDPKGLRELIDKKQDAILFFTNYLKNHTSSHILRKGISEKIWPLLVAIKSPIEQAHYVTQISSLLSIDERALFDDFRLFQKKDPKLGDGTKELSVAQGESSLEKMFGLVFYFESHGYQKEYELYDEKMRSILGEKYLEIREIHEVKKEQLLFMIEKTFSNSETLLKDALFMYTMYEGEYYKQELGRLRNEMNQDELLGLDTQEKIREVATITQKMQKK